jgi:hypothetical protein
MTLKIQPSDITDVQEEKALDFEEISSKQSVATKLERRRRIEDLNEERRLRSELGEF